MFDSHCHLTDPRLLNQLDEVLGRAAIAGVQRMVTIGTDPADHLRALSLCERHANVRCALGMHPNELGRSELSALQDLRMLMARPQVVAVGEIGLDYHYPGHDRGRQRVFFEAQLELADSLNKPVVLHCRDAIDDGLAALANFPDLRAVFHCFTGSLAEGRRVIAAGHYVGFTGVVTFGRSDELRQLAAQTPPDRILIETDAPYLSPEPIRKQRINEPAFICHTAAAVAAARKIAADEAAALTTANANRFYGWS